MDTGEDEPHRVRREADAGKREVVLAEKQWDSILASYSEDDPLHDRLVFAEPGV